MLHVSKSRVLSLDLNKSKVDADRVDVGMLFQHLRPATEKARSPKQVLDFRTFSSPLTSDCKRSPSLHVDRYSGAAP